ncbi:hypothetical protein GQ43DRAFT_478957 [Delitschia confertaspora ATCC 74209]|uniref:xanthine dehydrogenase n=1 Tax=Delitschia confertaspora ATCC 74209 TaxID=1513339 RepID=A0A9P4JUE8_9PLEO|nr:hypothetical protein GQ43DRAFT_478957 [Delitschia confertaspora ATCC 74209]
MALPSTPKSVSHPSSSTFPAESLTPLIGLTYTSSDITFYLNAKRVTLNNPNPHWTLLDYIRAQPTLKGTKLGCGEGGCGACTVVLQTRSTRQRNSIVHRAINACLFPLVGVDGKHIITIEGIGNVENPHPLQERIAKLHGSQCGFCTPGIVMSLYALVRNSWDQERKKFVLSEKDIESEGHLDGNLCRCTGYKPILEAAKTFVKEDLEGEVAEDGEEGYGGKVDEERELVQISNRICGRRGGCCQDPQFSCPTTPATSVTTTIPFAKLSDSVSLPARVDTTKKLQESSVISGATYAKPIKSREDRHNAMDIKTESAVDTLIPASDHGIPQIKFKPYTPCSELIFPPALWKYESKPLCYGNEEKIWFRPTTLDQLVELKSVYPSAKLVCGATEVQVEVRFKHSDYSVAVYIADIPELRETSVPSGPALQRSTHILIAANMPLTELEEMCKDVYSKIGRRAMAFEALRKQIRYFGGRQVRNVASLAGNIATASPISDANPILTAVDASIIVRSKSRGAITIPFEGIPTAYRTTCLPADAIITYIRIPLIPVRWKGVIKAYKQAKRKEDDVAIVNAAFQIRLDEKYDLVEDIRLIYGGMAQTTKEASKTRKSLLGKKWFGTESLEAGLSAICQDFDLQLSVPGGMAHYRKALALSLFFRFWHESMAELGLSGVGTEAIEEIQRRISSGVRDDYNPHQQRIVGKQIPQLSALKQCTGEAEFIDDIPKQDRELFGGLVISSKAHAKLINVNWTPALEMPGVIGYVDKSSISKDANIWGSVHKDEPFFADGEVFYHGQVIGMVYAETALEARAAARAVKVEYEELTAIRTIDEAIEAKSFFKHSKELKKGAAIHGRMEEVFEECDRPLTGTTRIGGQEHFYLETNSALVIPHGEDGSMEVWSSTQNTMETQEFVSQVTGVPSSRINARVKRMGGAFGGKESRSVPFACYVAIAAKKEKRPMRIMLTRDEDMLLTGQRHPFQARWKVGVSTEGKIIALDVDLYNNAGFSQDMSGAVMDRCMTHIDSCYEIPNVFLRGYVCKTNLHSNTAFRGFGAPQGMYFTETIMSNIAETLNIDIDELRRKNLYKVGDRTPFFQKIDDDWHIPALRHQTILSSDYEARKKAVADFNASKFNRFKKRGISLIPTKFGLSFATALHLNQGAAYVKIYHDGSILLHHSGTEMGQGLYTKMAQVAAQELGVELDAIFTPESQTYQIANASPTAASSGSDLNGMAVKDACSILNERLRPYRDKLGKDAMMKDVAHAAYLDRVNLAANGFYKVPRIGYEWGCTDADVAKPMYYYFTQGVGCSEVELDLLTGGHVVRRTDLVMDVGHSINPAIDYGQIEGAFVQGMGLFTTEESLWNSSTSQLRTCGTGTYKIPTFSSIPEVFNVSLLRHDTLIPLKTSPSHSSQGKNPEPPKSWKSLGTINSSKGIGEPPLFLGATVFFALREAVLAARKMNGVKEPLVLDSPATAERLRLAVEDEIVKMTKVGKGTGELMGVA